MSSDDYDAGLRKTVEAMAADAALSDEITAAVDEFFARHPDQPRTRAAELRASVTIHEQLCLISQ